MAHDAQYLRNLLQLRDAPRAPILWLLLPWVAGAWWSVRAILALLPLQSSPVTGWVTFFTIMAGRQFLFAGGLGTVATWGWLYYAWPEHSRMLCWAAVVGLIGLVLLPARAALVAPLVVSLCMIGAIAEQAIAMRVVQREPSRGASAA